ncbi:MAG: hypothetical protein CVV44_09325 [Spirochaetae bacterium HGW-Spirochaetae-1]|jgi:putative Mn2+ efflux pump MntP|nr:MAG: hypothetical protein CVV44_09325 [Spirochaetae bacterium HGW-Spirochaetae-1]
MDFISVLVIAVALAMDAFSVSVSAGMTIDCPGPRHYFRMSFHFGLFQFMMPILGYLGGKYLENFIRNYDHWVAFSLLFLIGIKMIKESFDKKDEQREPGSNACKDPSRGWTLIVLAVATSIDALAVGLTIGVLDKPIILPSIIIGIVCAGFSIIGIALGNRVGKYVSSGGEVIGGVMLILIGIKILAEHLL